MHCQSPVVPLRELCDKMCDQHIMDNDNSYREIGFNRVVIQWPNWPNAKIFGGYVSSVAVSCGYDTCFTVKACDGLYQLIQSIGSHWNTPLGFNRSCGPLSETP